MRYVRMKIIVHGRVQGVGFRYFAYAQAQKYRLNGYVRNLPDHCVESVVEGLEEDVAAYIERLRHGPTMAQVTKVDIIPQPYANEFVGFEIRH